MIKKKRFILVINKQDKADHYKATRYVYVVQTAFEKKTFSPTQHTWKSFVTVKFH